MGNGRSGITKTFYSGKKFLSNMSKRNIDFDKASFTQDGVDMDALKFGITPMIRLIQYMGLSKSELPNVNMFSDSGLSSNKVGEIYYGVGGTCNLGRFGINDIHINPKMYSGFTNAVVHNNIFAHEYGHALESMLVRSNLSNPADQINAWNNYSYAEQIISTALKNMGKDPSSWKTYAGKISNYATTNYSECLAEVCGAYGTYNRSVFVREVLKVFRDELKRK